MPQYYCLRLFRISGICCSIISLLTILPLTLSAQSKRVDSLHALLATTLPDTVRVNTLSELAYALYRNDPDKTEHYAREAIQLARQINYLPGVALAYFRLTYAMTHRTRFVECLQVSDTALRLYQQLHDRIGIATVYRTMGFSYKNSGNDTLALHYFFKSLAIGEELGDSSHTAAVLNLIGVIYESQNNLKEAMVHYQRSLRLHERYRPLSVVYVLINIGSVYRKEGRNNEARSYFERAVQIAEKEGDNINLTVGLRNIALLEREAQHWKESYALLYRALKAAEILKDKALITQTLIVLSATHRMNSVPAQALDFARRAMDSARAYRLKREMRDAAEECSLVLRDLGKYQEALEAYHLFAQYKDSVSREETVKQLATHEFMTKLREQQAEADRLRQDQANARLILWGVIGVLVIVTLLLLFVIRLNRQRARAYTKLNEQKELVEEQAREIEESNTELQTTNLELMRHKEALEEQGLAVELANNVLQEKNTELERLNKEKNDFLAIASHDLKNPLSSIVLSVSMVKRYLSKMQPDDVLSQMNTIEKTAARMINILVQILDAQILEEGKLIVHRAPIDVTLVVLAAVEEYFFHAERKNINLVYAVPEEHIGIENDEALLRQVLDNLISNAVKYSSQGKQVLVRVVSGEKAVRIEVRDEGPGLSDDDKERLFKKFTRLSAQPTGGEHSSGLGLSIVKKIVVAMNGKVWCESELGKGATFIVEFDKKLYPLNI